MRSKILTVLVAALLPLSAVAQDDMYFVPTKEQVKAEKEARQKQKEADKIAKQQREEALRKAYMKENAAAWKMEQIQIGNLENKENEAASQKPTYYSGINKSVDDYNRRKTISKSDTTVYSKDSIASDVIDFTEGNGYPNESIARVDTVYKYIIVDDDDYRYSRWMSRWDNYYWCGGFWGPWGWHTRWYGPWYDPFYDPWFDPWYWGAGWGPYWAYDPWFYGPGWGWGGYWGGWYGPGYYNPGWYGWGVGGYVHNYVSYRPGYGPANSAQRNDSHFYANHSNGRIYNTGSHSGISANSNNNYSVAQRNGGGTTINSGRTYNDRSTGWSHNTFRNSGNSYSNGGYSRSSGYSGGGSYSGGGGGGFSGGGGGGSHGGGGFSGGGGHGGGGGGHR